MEMLFPCIGLGRVGTDNLAEEQAHVAWVVSRDPADIVDLLDKHVAAG